MKEFNSELGNVNWKIMNNSQGTKSMYEMSLKIFF